MIYFEALAQTFDFGKFKGCDLGEVLMCAPDYITWVTNNIEGERCAFSEEIIEQMRTVFPYIELTDDLLRKIEQRRDEYLEDQYFKTVTLEEMLESDREDEECRMAIEETYDRYNGTYAQDEMGYSDDDIDTIFDGDPSAYWNID